MGRGSVTVGLRQVFGLVLVAIGMVTATAGLLTIVDVTLLDDTPEAADAPAEPAAPDVEAAPPVVPESPDDQPAAQAESAPDAPPPAAASQPELVQPTVPTVIGPPSEPAPDSPADGGPGAPDGVSDPDPPEPPAEPPPVVEVPITLPVATTGCGHDDKPEEWPWVERAGNEGVGLGWGPPIGGCRPAHAQAGAR